MTDREAMCDQRSPTVGQHASADGRAVTVGRLSQRMRDAGIVLITCTEAGEIQTRSPQGEDWLADLFCGSSLFRSCLNKAAKQWTDEADPTPTEAVPGAWLVPMPLMNRRKRTGYAVGIIPTDSLLLAEQLAALCQSAFMDLEMCRRLLQKLPPAATCDINRLAMLVRYMHDDQLRLGIDSQAIESVGKQLAESYEEISLLYSITQSMTVQERPERFVAQACQELLATLPYAWIGTQLADNHRRLKSMAGRFIVAGDPGRSASELRTIAQTLLSRAQPGAAIVLEPAINPSDAEFAALGKTVLIQPVSNEGEVIGLLIAGDKRGPDVAASSVDMKLLGATATHMAIFLENATLFDDRNAMFLGTLDALTASIDAKDRYTCGHSRRVAHLTKQLAQAVGLDEYTVGRMHIAGLVHDVGKIGVPEAVLLKPGKLNADEFEWIRRHPEMGYRILKDIPQLNDILPGVLYHHERWDGKGYPEGLSGEGIPLVARLIALADSFDAMSSTRTYRSSMSRLEVMNEIRSCVGAQFDPALAEVFVKLDFTEFDRLVQEHKAMEMNPSEWKGRAA